MPKGILTRKRAKALPEVKKTAHPIASVLAEQVQSELMMSILEGTADQQDIDREVNRRIAEIESHAAGSARRAEKGRWHYSWLLAPAQV